MERAWPNTTRCAICERPIVGRQSTALYCSERCKSRARFLQESPHLGLGCGSKIARLADVPYSTRLRAYRELMATEALTEDEVPLVIDAVLNPGDLSTRIG
jgi:hypothetical protein